MQVILKRDMDELGQEGDVVGVAKGYARNYLIPGGMAMEATLQNRKSLELQKNKIDARRKKAKDAAQFVKEQLEGALLTFSKKVGQEGKLYGSVTSMDIASALESQGIVIDRRKISLDKPFKTVGEFKVPVKVYPKVTANLNVLISPEEGPVQ